MRPLNSVFHHGICIWVGIRTDVVQNLQDGRKLARLLGGVRADRGEAHQHVIGLGAALALRSAKGPAEDNPGLRILGS
ncbi:hypothetical protein D3C79_939200 [compost metagenome]